MKVELLVNLLSSEGLLEKGTVFTDPLPSDIWDEVNLNRNTVKVLVDTRGESHKPIINETPPDPPVSPLIKKKRTKR